MRAFSTYLRMRGRDQFLVPKEDLEGQAHPVTWLRIKMLATRLRAGGSNKLADSLEQEWDQIARIMKVTEDYFGFYSDDFLAPVQATLTGILRRQVRSAWTTRNKSPISRRISTLLPCSSRRGTASCASPDAYEAWEGKTLEMLLAVASGRERTKRR